MTDHAFPTESDLQESPFQHTESTPTSGDVDIEALANEVWKLLKKNLREENERIARK